MRNTSLILLWFILAAFLGACQSKTLSKSSGEIDRSVSAPPDVVGDLPVAYLDGKPVTQSQLYQQIVPAHGGDGLVEILLNRSVKDRLKQEGIKLTAKDIDAERAKLLGSLDPDPDQAARLMKAMRAERGLDEQRLNALLYRNAGLRRLVRGQITVNEPAVQQAYELRYGSRYRIRLIVMDNLDRLTRIRRSVLNGEPFTDLATQTSTDISASQGGLLSPISPADSTYPKAIRDALPKLRLDNIDTRLSPLIALDSGYALLWLEDILSSADPPAMALVRDELVSSVRNELQRIRMRQLARTLIDQADVVVLDPALDHAWRRHHQSQGKP